MEDKKKKEISAQALVETPFNHTLDVQLRFNDIDALGHLNNSVYFVLFDLGKAKYFVTARGEEIDWRKTNIVVANVNCNFLAPTYFNENVAVQTQVSAMYDKSFKVVQQLINKDTLEVKCLCTTIMVGFDVKRGISAPIGEEWVEVLSRYEGRNLKTEK